MPDRQSRHPDNDLIDDMSEDATPGQQSRSAGIGGEVGTRAELERADGGEHGVTRATGSDNPSEDAEKGPKSREHIRSSQSKEG